MNVDKNIINEFDGFKDWREMILVCGQGMIYENYITVDYLESIIKSVEKHGPYFVVANKVAIAHSDIDLRFIKKMGVSWNILKDECLIGDQNPKSVKYLLILSTTNSTEHIEFLKNFAKTFMDKTLNEEFYKILDKEQLINFVEKIF